jgi:hypothetical protein
MLSPFNLTEPLEEVLLPEGDVVFRKTWDSGGPFAGAQHEMVLKWQEVYWVRDSYDGIIGPYETLKDALRSSEGLTAVTGATTELLCSELSRVELRKFLRIYLDEPVQFEWNGQSVRAHSSGRITLARKREGRTGQSSDCLSKPERSQASSEPGFLWRTYFCRLGNEKNGRPRFEAGRPAVNLVSIRCEGPVQSIATAILSYLAREHLPTMTLVEHASPSPSVLSFLFLDGGVDIEFVTDASTRRYLMVRVLGFEASRWLMYLLRLTQPRRLHGESDTPAHDQLKSRFRETKLRSLL